MKVTCLVWGMVAVLGWAGTALAEDSDGKATPAPTPAGSAEAPDIVRLKSGGMVRGTISEMDPAGSVTITTTTGKVREFPMTEVTYAGPAKDEPGPKPDATAAPAPEQTSQPYVTVHGKKARVQLKSTQGNLTFYRQADMAIATGSNGVIVGAVGFSRLCVAPCEIELPAGTEKLSVSPEGRGPALPATVTIPAGRSQLLGGYVDRKGTRAAGALVLVVGGIAGAVMLGVGVASASDGDMDGALVIGGLGVAIGSTLVGTVCMLQKDQSTFKVQPTRDTAARLGLQRDGLPKPTMLRWSTAL